MTEKLRVVVGSDNVFRDLGFPEAEAQNLLLRTDLVIHIRKAIAKLDLTQAAAAKRAEHELAAEQKAVDAERRAMASEMGELKASLEQMAAQRVGLVKALEPKLLTMFEQVARKRNGIAVSEARDGICTICHVRLRPQVFNTVRRNDAITQCDTCNRILYFVPVPVASPAPSDTATPPAS